MKSSTENGNTVLICQGSSGVSAGAREVLSAFDRELAKHHLTETFKLVKTGDRGLFKDVLVDMIMPELGRITYDTITHRPGSSDCGRAPGGEKTGSKADSR